ncbi:Shr3 amino acid permease chaperone [Rhodofomes roseus]|uniref:Shr3 amino acid permease chaperone n=1 Tax=Rhodofomes roseus TaxID=34475 RepID=A0ABQ8KNX1_9APHY|nr:Shr3 amino acid permease chaperone [Rhodofomes roseus]KAH9840105.1 Shr3 amino acid permease chaperone [Rhodofomes roseus]
MGFRQAAVLSSVSFFLGVLLICLNVDYRVLFTPLTDDVLRDGFEFYTTFYNSPPAIKALMHAVMGMGALGLCGQLNRWDESAIFFDGSSLAAYIFAMAVYISVGIPASRSVAIPRPEDTRASQVEALRVLSAGNTIIIVCLGAVLALQAGEEYARRIEAKAKEDFERRHPAGASKAPETSEDTTESKKDK